MEQFMNNTIKQVIATLRDYVERSTHWQEGGATRHDALYVALPVLQEEVDYMEKNISNTAKIAIHHLEEIHQLREALAWALENGAGYQNDYIVNGGCGCCCDELTPPEHLTQHFQRKRA